MEVLPFSHPDDVSFWRHVGRLVAIKPARELSQVLTELDVTAASCAGLVCAFKRAVGRIIVGFQQDITEWMYVWRFKLQLECLYVPAVKADEAEVRLRSQSLSPAETLRDKSELLHMINEKRRMFI